MEKVAAGVDGPTRNERFYRLIRLAGRILLWPFFALQIKGAELLPLGEAFLLLAKHQRWEDIPLLAISVPRGLYFVAKYELFRQPIAGYLLGRLGGLPLNRARPLESRRYLQYLVGLLRRGEGVVVFPEGTYYPGRIGPGQTGVIRLVLARLSLPLVPAGIHYESGRGRKRVTIRFGSVMRPPFPPPPQLVDEVMGRIAALSDL